MSEPIDKTNRYDSRDIVRRSAAMMASHEQTGEHLKLAAYRVRDPVTGEFSTLQFHATYGNTVHAVMSQEMARLFATFVTSTLEGSHGEAREQPMVREPATPVDVL